MLLHQSDCSGSNYCRLPKIHPTFLHTALGEKWGGGICSNIQSVLCISLSHHSSQSCTFIHAYSAISCDISYRHCPRIVAAQSEALEQNKRCPQIVAAGSKHVPIISVTMVTTLALALGLFVLYKLSPRLTAGVRGCAYYRQHLATIIISLMHTLSNHRRCLQAFQRNTALE